MDDIVCEITALKGRLTVLERERSEIAERLGVVEDICETMPSRDATYAIPPLSLVERALEL